MELKYSLEKKDYLTYQLFQASQSETVKKRRRRSWLFIPALYLVIGVLLNFLLSLSSMIIFIAFGLIWLLFYPRYSRWR